MKKISTYTLKTLPRDKTDLEALRQLSDEDITKAAKSDQDVALLTKKEWKEFQCPI